MTRRISILALCVLLLSLCAQSAFAARYDGVGYTAEIPNGWESGDEGYLSWANSPKDETQRIEWVTFSVEQPDLERYVQSYVKDGQFKMLSASSCIYVSNWGDGRTWIGVSPKGVMFSVTLAGPVPAVPSFLKSLTPQAGAEDAAEYAELFKMANAAEVVDWLCFTAPDLPAKPVAKAEEKGETQTKPFTGSGIKADLPVGWQAEDQSENSVAFTSPEGPEKGFVLVYVQPLPEGADPSEIGMQFVKEIEGKNIRFAEGSIEFTLDHSVMGTIEEDYQGHLLIRLFLEGDETSETLMRSVEIAGE